MSGIEIVELDPKRFEALAGHSRSPAAAYFTRELAWFSNEDESLIGVVLLDTTDADFAAILLARDASGKFRGFDMEASIATQEEAVGWLHRAMKWHTGQSLKEYVQGDETPTLDLFKSVVPSERQHPYFTILANEPAYIPARGIINEMMPHYIDVDGNFVEQFQSTGFDARLWELYLFAYFSEERLFIERPKPAPDFLLKKHDHEVAVEAVIVGRKVDRPPRYLKGMPNAKTEEEIAESHRNEMPIRFGSPLFTKLQKKYWELSHVSGRPLLFAIADFHDDQSMLWSSTGLIDYLYGVRHDFHYDDKGQLVIEPIKIGKHVLGGKEIPSGYFFQPEAENVSGVLFSSSGTISKFNRLGRQAGFKNDRVIMIRQGTCHNHDSNASLPKVFHYRVDEKSSETWGEGLSLFHNPNAKHHCPRELFPSIAHHRFDNGQIISTLPEFHPYASVTVNIRIKD